MEKIKLLSQKIWLDYNHYIIGAILHLNFQTVRDQLNVKC